jgi:transcriptional regulator with XRE-family HTH domain
MTRQPAPSFAGLLRQLRGAVKLTQEELAEGAGLSARAVSDLERGIHRTARKDTALMLARALGLTEPVAVVFVRAARGRAAPDDVLAALQSPGGRENETVPRAWNIPARNPAFTGRDGLLAAVRERLQAGQAGVCRRCTGWAG